MAWGVSPSLNPELWSGFIPRQDLWWPRVHYLSPRVHYLFAVLPLISLERLPRTAMGRRERPSRRRQATSPITWTILDLRGQRGLPGRGGSGHKPPLEFSPGIGIGPPRGCPPCGMMSPPWGVPCVG